MMSRRTIAAGGLGLVVLAAAGWPLGRHESPLPEPDYPPPAGADRTVSIRDFGAQGDGAADDTAAFQAAHDHLRDGGVILVEAGEYRVRSIRITHRHVTVRLAQGATLRRSGRPDLATRGMFLIELVGAHFALEGGMIDLNGEGPMEIGKPGRIPNRYGAQTAADIRAIAGPANAAIYALRASFVTISDVTIANTGETALLFRNCGHVHVQRCQFRNIANFGVEFSLVEAAIDGGTEPMPERGACRVSDCDFTDIDDYGLGTGNGVAVGGGGGGGQGAFAGFEITNCTFTRCQRDIHFEFLAGTLLTDLAITRIRSRDARQGSFGLVGVRDVTISDYVAMDPGSAPTAALPEHYPSVYGGALSGDFDRIRLKNVAIIDGRSRGIRIGRLGAINRGSRTFVASDARFDTGDIGAFLGIRGANPKGTWYVGRIVEILAPDRVLLDLPAAAGTTGATYSYGGATREGLILTHGGGVTLDHVRIVAGRGSGLPGEPPAAGLRLEALRTPVTAAGTTIAAPHGPDGGATAVRAPDRPSYAHAISGIVISGFPRATSAR